MTTPTPRKIRSHVALPTVEVGQRVYWHDPDDDLASGPGTVARVQYEPVDADTVIGLRLDDGKDTRP